MMTSLRAGDDLSGNDRGFDLDRVRSEFPGLHQEVHGRPLVYLDNAATTQKPQTVIDATSRAYREDCANVHRGVHLLSERATRDFEAARQKIASFIGAEAQDLVLTKGTTDSVNLVASSFGRTFMKPGDEIILTGMEHHSNIVPWQLLAQEKGLSIKVIPVTDDGDLDLPAFEALLSPRTRLIGVVFVSNTLGTINPIPGIVSRARGVPVLVDGAQALAHLPIDVRALGCDFFVASAHKVYGPTGVGILWGKRERLRSMPPYQGGGDMIATVRFEGTTFREPPARFEAGTPNIAGVIGLGAAIDYLGDLNLQAARAHEAAVTAYAVAELEKLPGLRLIGRPRARAGSVSFVLDDIHPHDIGTILDREGIAIRTGHHCTQPLMDRYGVPATARASFGIYNTRDEVDALVRGLRKVREVLG